MNPNQQPSFEFKVPEDVWQRALDKALTTESWPELDDSSDLVPEYDGPIEGLDFVNDDPYGDEDPDFANDGLGIDDLPSSGQGFGSSAFNGSFGADYTPDSNLDFDFDSGSDNYGGFDE